MQWGGTLKTPLWLFLQVKSSYKLSEDFKKGPPKPKKAAKAKVSAWDGKDWVFGSPPPRWHVCLLDHATAASSMRIAFRRLMGSCMLPVARLLRVDI